MSTSGMARKVDDLGRIVLPVEMRRLFGIQAGDALDIAVEDRGIVLRKVETRCVFCGGTEELRPHRGKQLCSSCAAELGAPAARQTARTGPAPTEPVPMERVPTEPVPGERAPSEVGEAEASRAHVFDGLPTAAEFAEQLPPPPEPSPAAQELDEAVEAGTVEELTTVEPQSEVVDTPPWES